ncbi:MAG: hypothetical protein AB7F99_08750 [Vicinamibacterales bacterium]
MSFTPDTASARTGDLNLSTHRSDEDVWTRTDREARRKAALPLVLGTVASLIAARAIAGRRWRGALAAGVGAGAAAWAAGNPQGVEILRQKAMAAFRRWRMQVDPIEEASVESFPASDSPSRTATVGTGLRRPTSH